MSVTPLIQGKAAFSGHANVVSVLFEKKADVNKREPLALYVAALNGLGEIAICLLDHGADVNAMSNQGFT